MRASFLALALAFLALAFSASSVRTSDAGALTQKTKNDYTAAYYPALKRCGDKPGPHLRKVPGEPSSARYHAWTRKLNGMCLPKQKLTPVANQAPAKPKAAPAAPTSSQTGGGGYSIPSYIVQCESGGNYSARNPSGAYGAYQIMPGTAAAYGCDLSTPSGQDHCAAAIYAKEGAAPWSCG